MVVGQLGIIDIIVIVVFFVAVISVGLWSSCRNRGSVGGYFLAGRSMHWIPVGASLFASNIGSGHFVGLAGSGAAGGIGIAVFEFSAILVLILLGWVFLPVYIAAGVFTMPEYLKKRFGGQRIRIYLSCLALILYIFTKISADLYAGAVFIEQSLNFDLYVSVIILLGIAAMFTVLGGLTAVIWTDFVQTIIMVVGAFWLMIAGFAKVGGYTALVEKFPASVANTTLLDNSTCGLVPHGSMRLMKPLDDEGLPWIGATVGLLINSIWYWCSDQVIVQRALAAKNFTHAKAGTLLAGYLKLLPMWLLVFPGMISKVLYPDEVGCTDAATCLRECDKASGCTDLAYPKLVLSLLGDGPRGLMMAVMVSSLVSSLTSIFNSASTIFTIDIWKRIRATAADWELMVVGRVFVLFMVAIGVAWIPIVKSGAELFHYIQAVTSYLAPPVCAVYMAAVLWKRCNEQGAFWGLISGFLIGAARFITEYAYPMYPCGQEHLDNKPDIISKVHYLHFGILLFFISLGVIVAVSLLTAPIPDVHLHRLTFWDRHSEEVRQDLPEDEVTCGCGNKEEDTAAAAAAAAAADGEKGYENPQFYGSVVDEKRSEGSNSESNAASEKPIPWYLRVGKWICGIEDQAEGGAEEVDEAELARLEKEAVSLEEDKFWKKIVDVNAVVIVAVCLFVWGFFS